MTDAARSGTQEPLESEEFPTGENLLKRFVRGYGGDGRHDYAGVCPSCGENCRTVGIPHLAYTYEECDCGEPDFEHLIEQLWHRNCLPLSGSEGELKADLVASLRIAADQATRGREVLQKVLDVIQKELAP